MIDCEIFFKVLSDRTRQEILKLLEKGEKNVSELVKILNTTQPNVSHHLNILKGVGLIKSERRGQEIYYSFNKDWFRECCGNFFSLFECCGEFFEKYKIGEKEGDKR